MGRIKMRKNQINNARKTRYNGKDKQRKETEEEKNKNQLERRTNTEMVCYRERKGKFKLIDDA